MLEIDSLGDTSQAPSLDPDYPTAYDLLLSAGPAIPNRSPAIDVFRLAFDQLNFSSSDDATGTIRLKKVEVFRVPLSCISEVGTPTVMTFDSSTQSWVRGPPRPSLRQWRQQRWRAVAPGAEQHLDLRRLASGQS